MKSVRMLIRPIDWGEAVSQAAAVPLGGRGKLQTHSELWFIEEPHQWRSPTGISNDLNCLLMQTWTLAPLTPCMKECFIVIRLHLECFSPSSFTSGIDMHLFCSHQGPTALQHTIVFLFFLFQIGNCPISPHQIESRHLFSFIFIFNGSRNQLREVFSSSTTTTTVTFFLCQASVLLTYVHQQSRCM